MNVKCMIFSSETEVKKLLDAFFLNVTPNLNNRDPDVIAGCIKRFLRELRVCF